MSESTQYDSERFKAETTGRSTGGPVEVFDEFEVEPPNGKEALITEIVSSEGLPGFSTVPVPTDLPLIDEKPNPMPGESSSETCPRCGGDVEAGWFVCPNCKGLLEQMADDLTPRRSVRIVKRAQRLK